VDTNGRSLIVRVVVGVGMDEVPGGLIVCIIDKYLQLWICGSLAFACLLACLLAYLPDRC
jgi:hypothetical protein